MKKFSSLLIVASACASFTASAAPIDPTYEDFEALPVATFGGSGIPNTAVAIDKAPGVTIGLSATQRFGQPAVLNDGAGTFTAVVGSYPGLPSYARWNFNFYVDAPTGYFVELLYDFDPGVDTDSSKLGSAKSVSVGAVGQDSWNLGFLFLDTGAPGVTPPEYASFDPNAAGEYSFALIVRDASQAEVARAAINVNVSVPDGGTSLVLLGLGLAGLMGVRRFNARA